MKWSKPWREIPGKLAAYLQDVREIEALAKMLYNRDQVFFIGRGLDAAVSYEGSLKLKEISYINSFAIAAGELKHGTIALMEPGHAGAVLGDAGCAVRKNAFQYPRDQGTRCACARDRQGGQPRGGGTEQRGDLYSGLPG